MNDNPSQSTIQERFAEIFARLRDQDIEQFYANYQLWVMRQRFPILENEIQTLRAHIEENQQYIQALRPSAIALAVLARLQSNGVSDIDLLDQMLERGEDWLDRMMQRLDYCEQVEDFIQGDYTQWCANSLEGAYDWIDSLRGSSEVSPTAETSSEAEVQATEELLLHKLSFDDEETMLGVTTKRPALVFAPQPEIEATAEESFIKEENPTYEQALAILTGEDVVLADEISVEANLNPAEHISPPEQTDESAQPAPWYSLSLDENEPFDFEHPGSMDDWIKILQADTAAISSETPEIETIASSAAEVSTPTMSDEHAGQVEEAISELAEPEAQLESIASELVETEAAEPIILEPTSEEEATTNEREVNIEDETAASASATLAEQDEEAAPEPGELLIAAEENVESEQGAHNELANELNAEEAALIEPEPTEEPGSTDELAASEQIEVLLETALPAEEATSELLEAERVPADEEKATSELPEVALTPASEEEITSETLSEEHVQSTNEEESESSAGAEELVLARPVEGVVEELILAPVNMAEEHQGEIEEAAIVNAILEPEEGQLPWYEYLALEKTTSGELQSQNEIEEQIALTGELSASTADPFEASTPTPEFYEYALTDKIIEEEIGTSQAERSAPTSWETKNADLANDETQPLALREIQLAQQGQGTTSETPLANVDEVLAESVSANDESSEVTNVDLEKASEIGTAKEARFDLEAREEITEKLNIPQNVSTEQVLTVEEQVESVPAEQVLTVEEQVESTPLAAPQVAVASSPAPVQEQPKKVSFWQWLFRRKRKK